MKILHSTVVTLHLIAVSTLSVSCTSHMDYAGTSASYQQPYGYRQSPRPYSGGLNYSTWDRPTQQASSQPYKSTEAASEGLTSGQVVVGLLGLWAASKVLGGDSGSSSSSSDWSKNQQEAYQNSSYTHAERNANDRAAASGQPLPYPSGGR